ncbi:MAG: riboflavin synthase [Alphaproteobacteria bacterium]|nr:riboflavin synthase [Alphaproteobacteria bacterium]
MFTGLVQDMGIVRVADKTGGGMRLGIETKLPSEHLLDGASVCCAGVCLTIVDRVEQTFFVEASAETLGKTTLGSWTEETKINLEPSLRVGDPLGGHFVSGHIDGIAKLKEIKPDGDSHRLIIEVPQTLKRFIAPKGSVTLDGVSLTVNEVEGCNFGVNIIPHTWSNTTLGLLGLEEKINIEIDILARYVENMLGQSA